MLASFACGRSTSLVLDCGMNRTTSTPVNDGYALQKCLMQVGVGGNTLTDQIIDWIEKDQGAQIRPRYSFKRKLKSGVEG